MLRYPDPTTAKEHIGEQLKLIYELIGLRPDNWPSTAANIAIADFVFSKYKNFAAIEIKYAFDLAFQNRLSVGVKLEHFQAFSIPYMDKILAAYVEFKSGSLEKVDKYSEAKKELDKTINRFHLSDQAVKEIILSSYSEILSGIDISYGFSMENHYDVLHDLKMIDFTTEQKLEILLKAEQQLKDQMTEYQKQISNKRISGKDVQSISFTLDKIKEKFNDKAHELAKTITFKKQLLLFKERKVSFEMLHNKMESVICWRDPQIIREIKDLKRKIHG